MNHIFNDLEGEFKFSSVSFDELFDKVICFLEKQSESLKKSFELQSEIKQTKISKYYNNLLEEFHFSYDTGQLFHKENNFYNFISILRWKNLSLIYNSISLLKVFSECTDNIVLIGGNGKGKTSLANNLKGSDLDSISIIGAQKNLYFSTHDQSVLRTEKQEIIDMLLDNNIKNSKTDHSIHQFHIQLSNQFTKLIIAMQTEYTNYLYKCDLDNDIPQIDKTVFGKVRKLFKILFNEITLFFQVVQILLLTLLRMGKNILLMDYLKEKK